jgi:thioredoxin-like negative regulator of GroEL
MMGLKKSLLCALGVFALLSPATARRAHAQEDLPPAAVEAEDTQQWDKAIAIYKKTIILQPQRYDLWVRITDIEADRDNPTGAETALYEALKIKHRDPNLLSRYVQLAEWAGDNAGAEATYRILLKMNPGDDETRFKLATVLSWEGKTKESIAVLEPYIKRHPQKKDALLLMSQLYMWNGDLYKADTMIERYKQVAGEDKDYQKVKMQILANENKNIATVKAADKVLQTTPNDCDGYTDKATALTALRRYGDMQPNLAGADKNCVDKPAGVLLDRKLTTQTQSYVRGDYTYSSDNDTIDISTYTLDGRYKLNPGTYVTLGGETGWLRASAASGFEAVNGNSSINQSAAWIGIDKQAADAVWVNGKVGYHDAGNGLQETPIGHIGTEIRAIDIMTLTLDTNHDFYSVSPEALSKGVKLTDNQALATFNITPVTTFEMKANYGLLSDSNHYWSLTETPRQTILKDERWNADINFSAQQTGFANSVSDGYYDPTRFRQYMIGTDVTYNWNVDDKIGLILGTGYNEDDTMTSYKRADNYALETTIGLYQSWMFNAHIGHSDSIGLNSEQYRVNDYTANLTRRF